MIVLTVTRPRPVLVEPDMNMITDTWKAELGHFRSWLSGAGQSVHTIELRTYYLRRFAVGIPHPWRVELEDLSGFVGQPGWKAETRKSARAALRAFYSWGSLAGRIAVDPSRLLPAVRIPRSLAKPTPEDVLARALATATDRDRLMMMFGAYAGLRRAEIAGLRWSDVGEVVFVRGKGARERAVPTHQRLRLAIATERQLRDRGLFGSGYRYGDPSSPWIFLGQSGGPITPGAVGSVLSRCLGDYSGHTLRHRFASRAHEGTRDMPAVQELLGHSSLETTRRYVAVTSAALRAAVDAA